MRNSEVSFRRSNGIYEYLLMLLVWMLISLGLSLLIFLYAIPRRRTRPTNTIQADSTPFEQAVERFVARLENSLFPLQ